VAPCGVPGEEEEEVGAAEGPATVCGGAGFGTGFAE